MTDIVKLYNPANATSLTPEQVEGLQHLTNEEIEQLAQAYPNGSQAYLLIADSSKGDLSKQLPSLSTFRNLLNLRTKSALKGYVAIAFKTGYRPANVTAKAGKKEVLDLSDTELLKLPGFKTSTITEPAKEVKVKKIKKEKVK